MNRHLIVLKKSIWIVLLAVVLACGEEPPPAPQPKAVSKKIAIQQPQPVKAPATPAPAAAPSTAAPAQTAAPATPAETPGASEAPATPPASGAAATEVEKSVPGVAPVASSGTPEAALASGSPSPAPTPASADASTLVKESLQLAAAYDPEGRFDPFEPLFKDQQTQTMPGSKEKRAKRSAQTPLERVALAQLKVTAIIRAASGNRALVEDATGKGYVVQVGTYMGLNSGQVVRIDNDRIVVEEEIESVMGELRIENQELKLQKPAGEL